MIHIYFWWHVTGSFMSFIKAILFGHVINQSKKNYNWRHACLTKENNLGLFQSAMELLQIATVRRYSVKGQEPDFILYIYITTLPSVKEPFSPEQHSKFSSLAGLQNLWFNGTFMVPAHLFSSQVLL